MADGAEDTIQNDQSNSNRKKQKASKGHEITNKTIRAPSFSYACLELISDSPSATQLDELTVRSYIMSALTRFLGISGTAIAVDILKIDKGECWIRVPREDLSPTVAAVGGWIGGNENEGRVAWRIKTSGNWLSSLAGSRGVGDMWND